MGPIWSKMAFFGSGHILAVTALPAFFGPKNKCWTAAPNGSNKVPRGFRPIPGG